MGISMRVRLQTWMKCCAAIVCVLILVLGLLSVRITDSLPIDFEIVAEFYAGYSDWESWTCRISRNGRATLEFGDTRRVIQVPHGEMLAIAAAVERARFFNLHGNYSFDVTDHPTLVITVSRMRVRHSVRVYAPSYLTNDEGVRGFLLLWAEIIRAVPPPNPEQTPDLTDILAPDVPSEEVEDEGGLR